MSASTGHPRTLTQMLREWDDDNVARLLRERPDLAFPIPTDFSQIASRATTRQSVSDTLDTLTAAELAVVAAAIDEPAPFSGDTLVDRLGEQARDGVEHVWRVALLWGDWDSLRPVRALAGLLDESPPKTGPSVWKPPTLNLSTQPTAIVDKAAAGSAFEFVRRMDVLVEHLDHHAVRLTRAGSFASRDVRSLAQLLDASGPVTLTSLELARAAGLVGLVARELSEALIPTDLFEQWQRTSLASQWAVLASTWIDRHPASGSSRFKRMCLDVFGDPREGNVVTAKELQTWLRWHRPRRPANADRLAAGVLDTGATIGLTGRGAIASYAYPVSAEALEGLLPQRVEHVLVQADLTAIAPGPLTPEAAQDLGALADVESRGGATVYRFTPASLSRAHQLGWSAADILETLTTRSRTPVPQPLEYLVRELDRPGRRPMDTTTHPTAVRRLHLPPPRAAVIKDDENLTPADRLDDNLVTAVLTSLRAADTDASNDEHQREAASTAPGEHFMAPTLDTLREAVETHELVWLGFVDSRGQSSERVVHVASTDGGTVVAEDTHGARLELPIHRVSAAHIIRAGGS